MNNYKPYSYLYKKNTDPKQLMSCFTTQIPANKKVTLATGYPSTSGSKTTILYNIGDDVGQPRRTEEFENEFTWDGNSHDVEVIVGSGSGDGGGTTVMGSDQAEWD